MADSRGIIPSTSIGSIIASSASLSSSERSKPNSFLESKEEAKQYPEMEAYVRLFKQITLDRIEPQYDPYEHWITDSNLNNKMVAFASNISMGIYKGTSKIKTVTKRMKQADPNNPYYKMIEGYLIRHSEATESVAQPTIKKLATFILKGMGYVFLSIETGLRTDLRKRIIHYEAMRDLCLDLISHKKWSIDYSSWKSLFSSDHGTYFSLFIHKLLLKLNKNISEALIEAKPLKLQEHVTMLERHLKNALASSKGILIGLISNVEVPSELFHEDNIAQEIQTQDYHYCSTSDAIPADIRKFLGNEKRHRFIAEHFFSREYRNIVDDIDSLADRSANQSIHQRQLKNDDENNGSVFLTHPTTAQESKTDTLGVIGSTLTTVALPGATSADQISRQGYQLQERYDKFLTNQDISFQLYFHDTVPSEIKKALRTQSTTNSVIQAKHDKATAFSRTVHRIFSISHLLEKNRLIANTIKNIVNGGGDSHSSFLIDSYFQILAYDLRTLAPEINMNYQDLINKSLHLRNEITSLNKSEWSLNVNLALREVHDVLDLFRKIIPLLNKIQQDISLNAAYAKLKVVIKERKKGALLNLVMNNIYLGKEYVDENVERLACLTYESGQIQRLLSIPGKQHNRTYLDYALKQALMPPPPKSSVRIEEIPDEVEITVNDLETAVLTRHRSLTIGSVFTGKITDDEKPFLEIKAPGESRRIPLSQAAKGWLQAKQDSETLNISASVPLDTDDLDSHTPLETKAMIPSSVPDFHRQNQQDRHRINQLRQQNTELTLKIENLTLAQQLKDRHQDFSFRIFKPSWWWATGIGFIVHCFLMLGAAIYRLRYRQTIQADLAAYRQLEILKTTHQRTIESNNQSITRLEAQIRNSVQLSEIKLQPSALAATPVQDSKSTLEALSLFAPARLHTEEEKESKYNTDRTVTLSEDEHNAMTEQGAKNLAIQLLKNLNPSNRQKVKSALSKARGNLNADIIHYFETAFATLPAASKIINPAARRIIYLATVDILQPLVHPSPPSPRRVSL